MGPVTLADRLARAAAWLGDRLLNTLSPSPVDPATGIETGAGQTLEDLNQYADKALRSLRATRWPFGAAYDSQPDAERARARSTARVGRLGPYEAPEVYDVRHHGGYQLNVCRGCGWVAVAEIGNPICLGCGQSTTPSPSETPSVGDSPGVIGDGFFTTALTPGHTNVEAIAAVIDHHRPDSAARWRDKGGWTGIGTFQCTGLGCTWTGGSRSEHSQHVAELIAAMSGAERSNVLLYSVPDLRT